MRALVAIGLVVVAITAVACTSRPFDPLGERAVGRLETGIGDTYRMEAGALTATWTFTREADIVLRFEVGTLSFQGARLEPGCYSDTVTDGDVLEISDAHNVSLSSPDSDASCRSFPR